MNEGVRCLLISLSALSVLLWIFLETPVHKYYYKMPIILNGQNQFGQ